MSNTFLCYKQDIPIDGCKGFALKKTESEKKSETTPDTHQEPDTQQEIEIEKQDEQQDIFIVNRESQYFAYKNSCPHTGASLNWQPNVFMDYDNFYIQCAIHAARFEVESGLCVWGPCVNRSLQKIKLKIVDDKIFLAAQ